MPTQRIIKSTFIGLNNEPLRNATVQVIHMQGNTIDNVEYPQVTKNFITNREGQINFTLWCNEEGERASFYRFILPGGETFDAIVPVGTSDLELSVLREGGGNSSTPQYQSLISYILSEVGSGAVISTATPTVSGKVKVNSPSDDPIVYLKSEIDNLLSTKANSTDIYTKVQTNNLVNAKPDTLSELGDTTVSSVTNGQALIYNSSTSRWENQTLPTGSIGISTNINSVSYDSQNRVSSYIVSGTNYVITYNTLTTVVVGGGKTRTITYNTNGQLVSDITI